MQSFYTTFFFLAIFVTISLMYICCSSTSWVVKFSKVMKNIKCKHHKWRRNVQVLESQISLTTDSLAREALINDASCTYYYETRLYEIVLKIVSLRNRTAERRGRQNAFVWQTWQAYYLCVLWWSSLKLMFCGLLRKDLFKGRTIRKNMGGGEGNFRAAGIFFRYQIPCMNFFQALAWIFLRVNWRARIFFHVIFPCANFFFVLRPPPYKFSNGPSLILLSRLSHKVCRLLSSAVLLRKLTNIARKGKKSN